MKRIALCFLFAFCFVPELRAEPPFFEDKTIRLVLGFSPGGISDLWARALARAMAPHIRASRVSSHKTCRAPDR